MFNTVLKFKLNKKKLKISFHVNHWLNQFSDYKNRLISNRGKIYIFIGLSADLVSVVFVHICFCHYNLQERDS